MIRIFIVLLFAWLAIVPSASSQCPTNPGYQYETICTGNVGKILLSTFDISSYNPDSLTFSWSTGEVTRHPNTSSSNQMFVTGSLGGLVNGVYHVTISDDDGCTWTAGPLEIDCTNATCDHLTALSWECTYFPSSHVDVMFTHAVWDVTSAPATPYTYEWSNGVTTLGTMLPGGVYGTQLYVEDYQVPLTVTITDDIGCTWVEDAVSDCNNPAIGMTYECVDDLADITAIIWDENYADSTLTFTWSNGEVTPMVIINSLAGTILPNVPSGVYSLDIETSGGQIFHHEITVDCDSPDPTNDCNHIMGANYECVVYPDSGTEVTVRILAWDVDVEPPTPWVFEWSNGQTTYSNFDGGFLLTEMVAFNLNEPLFVTITDDEGCSWSSFVEVNCLYPGDTDLNGAVNHYDLLNIGLGFDSDGAPRSSASVEWVPQSASSWDAQTPESIVNYVFSDVNGNGLVEEEDENGIEINWGKTITANHTFENDRNLPTIPHEPIPFYVEVNELTEGEAYSLPVMLGNSLVDVNGAYGVAFTVEYDPEVFDAENINVNYSESWLGDFGDDLMAIARNFPEEGYIEIALTRTDGTPTNGQGILCELEFIVIEDVIFMNNNSENMESEIKVTGSMLINEKEEKLGVVEMSTQFDVTPIVSSTNEEDLKNKINLSPNPASSFVNVRSSYLIEKICIYTPAGKVLVENIVNAHSAQLKTFELPTGIYLIEIQTEKGNLIEKLMVK